MAADTFIDLFPTSNLFRKLMNLIQFFKNTNFIKIGLNWRIGFLLIVNVISQHYNYLHSITGSSPSINQTRFESALPSDLLELFFVCFGFFVPFEIFHSYGDVTIASERLQIFYYSRNSWLLSSEGSLACHTYCDMRHLILMVIS